MGCIGEFARQVLPGEVQLFVHVTPPVGAVGYIVDNAIVSDEFRVRVRRYCGAVPLRDDVDRISFGKLCWFVLSRQCLIIHHEGHEKEHKGLENKEKSA
jgi:hypothetical protein